MFDDGYCSKMFLVFELICMRYPPPNVLLLVLLILVCSPVCFFDKSRIFGSTFSEQATLLYCGGEWGDVGDVCMSYLLASE